MINRLRELEGQTCPEMVTDEDIGRLWRGIGFGVLFSLPFWIAVAALVWWLV